MSGEEGVCVRVFVVVLFAGQRLRGDNPMLADERVPKRDVVCDVANTEDAVAGTKNLDAATVTHEGVVELHHFVWGIQV